MMPGLHVLLFTDADVFAGTERHIADLGQALRDEGVTVTIGCPTPSPLAEEAGKMGLSVRPIAKRGSYDGAAIESVAAFLRNTPGRVVHCHNGRSALIATLARQRAGVGHVVLTQHFLSPAYATRSGWKKWVSDCIHGWVDRRLDHVIAISDAVRENVLARGEASADRVTRVHNGASDFHNSRESAKLTQSSTPGTIRLLCAARLEKEKRVDVLIEAMGRLAEGGTRIDCIVAGQGRDHASLVARARELNLGTSIHFAGFVNDVPSLMAAADIFVLPADAEPFGLVLLEAMRAMLPVIACDAGGPREIVIHGQTGLLVPPGDAAALAEAIANLIGDSTARERMAKAGRLRFEQCFTAQIMARETIQVYRQVLGLPRFCAITDVNPATVTASNA